MHTFSYVLFGALAACGGIATYDPSLVHNGSLDAGADSSKGDVAPPVVQPACGTPVTPNAACSVSFRADIYPLLTASPVWKCTNAGCHSSDDTQPAPYGFGLGSPQNPDVAYAFLAKSNAFPRPTINPCSTSASDSYLYCSVGGGTQCGPAMPQGLYPSPKEPLEGLDVLKTWLECGSPNN